MNEIKLENYASFLKPRPRDAHKGMFGHVLIVGGYRGMSGAARMAGEAAARVGAGLVSIATHNDHSAFLNVTRPELMVQGINDNQPSIPQTLLDRATFLVVGPGLGQDNWSQQLFQQTLKTSQHKLLDADALNLLAKQPQRSDNWILTPHIGEAARLLNCTTQEIQNDRTTAIRELQKRYGGVIVLKGADTLVMNSQQHISVCHAGNPGMASGGMGDVLSGVIAGLASQHLSLLDAAELGVCVHASAGDLAAKHGERGMLAMDLMPYLQQLVN